jgi:hypothetical protein
VHQVVTDWPGNPTTFPHPSRIHSYPEHPRRASSTSNPFLHQIRIPLKSTELGTKSKRKLRMPDTETGPDSLGPISQPLFYILGPLLLAFWWITIQHAPNGEAKIDLPTTWNIVYLQWLEPHVTSPFRKTTALAVYLGILGVQLLEGWWILQVDWKVLSSLWAEFLLNENANTFHNIQLMMALGVWGAVVLLSLCAGALIVVVQLSCIGDILSMTYGTAGSVQRAKSEKELAGFSGRQT